MELKMNQETVELVHKSGNWLVKQDVGFSPVELLVASIGSCGAYVYEKILKNSSINFTIETIEISYERNQEKPSKPLSSVDILFTVHVDESEQGKAQRALKLIAKHCPVMQSLDPAVQVVERVNFI